MDPVNPMDLHPTSLNSFYPYLLCLFTFSASYIVITGPFAMLPGMLDIPMSLKLAGLKIILQNY